MNMGFRFKSIKSAALYVALMAIPSVAMAENQLWRFSVLGVPVGQININAESSASNYNVKINAGGAGLVGKFADYDMNGSASGSVSGMKFKPKSYKMKSKSGRIVTMSYAGGVPKVTANPAFSKKSYSISPSAQGGTLDPISAGYNLLMDANEATVCNRKLVMYDGKERSQLSVGKATKSDGYVVCNGTYSRLAGYSAKKLKSGKNFPFTIYYQPKGNGMLKAVKIVAKTKFGNATATRK